MPLYPLICHTCGFKEEVYMSMAEAGVDRYCEKCSNKMTSDWKEKRYGAFVNKTLGSYVDKHARRTSKQEILDIARKENDERARQVDPKYDETMNKLGL